MNAARPLQHDKFDGPIPQSMNSTKVQNTWRYGGAHSA